MAAEECSIIRKEYGYANANFVGVTRSGNILLANEIEELPRSRTTRVIWDTIPVDNAPTAPFKAYFDPTLVCPLFCSFCLAGAPEYRKAKLAVPQLSERQATDIAHQMVEAGILAVKVAGGEPFTYPPFWNLIPIFGEAGMAISTSTSGITLPDEQLLTKSHIALLVRHQVRVSLSIDGGKEYHDGVRGKDGLFADAVSGIERLRDCGVPRDQIQIRSTVTSDPNSIAQLSSLNDLSQSLGLIIRIRLARPYGSAKINGTAVVSPTETYLKTARQIRDLARTNSLINLDSILAYDAPPHIKTGLDCGAATRHIGIDAFGNMLTCGALEQFLPNQHAHLIGTDRVDLLTAFRTNPQFLTVRNYLNDDSNHGECAVCEYKHSCQGGCTAVRLETDSKRSPLCLLAN